MWKYYNNKFSFFLLLGYVLIFTACANQIPPTGGARDKTPPRIIPEQSDVSMQTNFTARSFQFTFDEWIKLADVYNEVVVSPPLEFTPDVSLKKKTVRFEFDEEEVLRADATYTVNFGKAVKDLNESNPAEDLRFVFATGDFIDSLVVQGRVVDGFTGEAVEDVVVMLYDNLADSVVRTERPFYFARTSKEGTFKINNVKADSFKVFGLVDKNLNYLFDLPNEQIAYTEDPIIVADSVQPFIELQLFEETQALRLTAKEIKRYGKVTLVFNQPPDENIKVSFDSILQQHHLVYEKDSIHLWYHLTDSIDWSIYLQKDSLLNDTVKVKALNQKKYLAKAKLQITKGVLANLSKQNPSKPLELMFNHPLLAIDTSVILLLEDTLSLRVYPEITIESDNPKAIQLDYTWQEGKHYQLLLLPNAITDWYGLQNDSIPLSFTMPSLADFGNIILQVKDLKEETPYVIQLLKGKELIEESDFQADSVYTKKYRGIQPGGYGVRIIEDTNGNQRWDPGNYALKTQPEKLYFRLLEELRANWDLEVEFSLADPEKKKQ